MRIRKVNHPALTDGACRRLQDTQTNTASHPLSYERGLPGGGVKEIMDELIADVGRRHKEVKNNPKFISLITTSLPQLMAQSPDKFPTDWNRSLTEDEMNEMRMLAKGIRLKPFEPKELSLIEKRDLFLANAKSLIEKTFFTKKITVNPKSRN